MYERCPGANNILMPTIKIKRCPECGEEVEVVSSDMQTSCPECGFIIYNDLITCVQWCKYAEECVGEEVYDRLRKQEEDLAEKELG